MPSISRKAEIPTASLLPTPHTALSDNREVLTNTIFGVFAIIFAAATLWQGHKLWRTLRRDVHQDSSPGPVNGIASTFSGLREPLLTIL